MSFFSRIFPIKIIIRIHIYLIVVKFDTVFTVAATDSAGIFLSIVSFQIKNSGPIAT